MQAVLRMQGAQNGLAGSSAQNGLDTDAGSSANCSVVGFNGTPLCPRCGVADSDSAEADGLCPQLRSCVSDSAVISGCFGMADLLEA